MKMIIAKKSLFNFFVSATLLVLFFSFAPLVRADGVLAISTDAATPLASDVAPGASNVELTRIDFSTSGAGTILGIALNLQTAHLSNVTAFKIYDVSTATQIGAINVFDSSGNGYTGSISFPIAANVTKVLSIKADIGTMAVVGDVIRVGLNNVVASGWNNITGFTTNQAFGNPMTIAGADVLTITTSSPFPNARVGTAYSTTVSASGGTGAYTWQASSDSLPLSPLPPGLSFAPNPCLTCQSPVTIMGIPTTAGIYTFKLQVSTSATVSTSKQFSLTVDSVDAGAVVAALDASSPLTTTLNPGQAGVAFSKIKLSNGSSSVTLNNIQISSDTVFADKFVQNIKIFNGTTQVGTTVSNVIWNGSYYYQWVPVNLTLPAGNSTVLTLTADVLSSVGYSVTMHLGIAELNFNAPGATVTGLPVYGNNMTIISSGATSSSITVLSPNGGETWIKGTTQTIKWQDTAGSLCPSGSTCFWAGVPYDITLSSYSPPCTGTICPMYDIAQRTIAKSVYSYSYAWTIPNCTADNPCSSNFEIPTGSYTIQVCQTGTNTCDSSDSYFKIVSGVGTNSSPIIIKTGFTNPSDVKVGQPVSFSWSATDANNDDLSWSVDWGEGIGSGNKCMVNPPSGTGQNWNYSESHAWNTAGIYLVKVNVSDCKGGTAETSFKVNVGGITSLLSVSLDPSTPVSQTIVPGASNMNVATFKITTAGADVAIQNMTFGINRSPNFCPGNNYRLYDMNSGTQIGQVSYTDSGCNFSFGSLSYVIPANSSKSVSVKLDFSPSTIAGTFAVNMAYIGTTAGETVGGLPVVANTMTVSNTPDDLQFSVATDKLTYKPDEKIQITIYAINNSTQTKVLNFNSGCQVSYSISSLNEDISYDSAKGVLCTKNLTSVSIAPQSKNIWTLTHTPDLFRLNDGTYSLTGRVIGYGDANTTFGVKSPEIPIANQHPLGWLDSISKDGLITGWAVDPDHLDVPINIHVYFDGPTGGKGGTEPIAATTDIQRDDVNLIMSATGTHGFKIAIPDSFRDGKKHAVYIYAVDVDDASGASNAQLWGSPKTFSLKSNNVARHPRGTVVLGEGATVYFLGAELRYPFPSPDVFFSWGHKFSDLVLANAADLAMPIGPIAGLKQ